LSQGVCAQAFVHADAPNTFHPIHTDDIITMVPKLLDVAGTPPTTVNWGGDEKVSVEEWCAYLSELTGVELQVRSERELAGQRRPRSRQDA
jgi:hypothetical protein